MDSAILAKVAFKITINITGSISNITGSISNILPYIQAHCLVEDVFSGPLIMPFVVFFPQRLKMNHNNDKLSNKTQQHPNLQKHPPKNLILHNL